MHNAATVRAEAVLAAAEARAETTTARAAAPAPARAPATPKSRQVRAACVPRSLAYTPAAWPPPHAWLASLAEAERDEEQDEHVPPPDEVLDDFVFHRDDDDDFFYLLDPCGCAAAAPRATLRDAPRDTHSIECPRPLRCPAAAARRTIAPQCARLA